VLKNDTFLFFAHFATKMWYYFYCRRFRKGFRQFLFIEEGSAYERLVLLDSASKARVKGFRFPGIDLKPFLFPEIIHER